LLSFPSLFSPLVFVRIKLARSFAESFARKRERERERKDDDDDDDELFDKDDDDENECFVDDEE
jgi:hypothetical protein